MMRQFLSVAFVLCFALPVTAQSLIYDSTFGYNGRNFSPKELNAYTRKIVTQADGKVLLLSNVYTNNSSYVLLSRYLQDGSPDSTWGYNGLVIFIISDTYVSGSELVIQPD